MLIFFVGSLEYGFLLWLPMFLEELHFEDFEGYISITFSLFSILGSSIYGWFYQKNFKRINEWRSLFFGLVCSLIGVLILYHLELDVSKKWTVLGLIGFIGFFIGAVYNISMAHELIKENELENDSLTYLMNLCSVFLCFGIGVTDIIVGAISDKFSYHSIFILFLGYLGISLLILIAKMCIGNNQTSLV